MRDRHFKDLICTSHLVFWASGQLLDIICYCVRSDHISTQLEIYGRFWTNMSDIPLFTIIKTPDEGMSFGRTVLAPSRRAPETCKFNPKLHWSWFGGTWRPDTLLRHFVLPLICHPSVPVWDWHAMPSVSTSATDLQEKSRSQDPSPAIVTAGDTLKLNTEISLRSSLTHWSDREGTAPAFSARLITHRKRNKHLRDPWSVQNNWVICNGEIDSDSESRRRQHFCLEFSP